MSKSKTPEIEIKRVFFWKRVKEEGIKIGRSMDSYRMAYAAFIRTLSGCVEKMDWPIDFMNIPGMGLEGGVYRFFTDPDRRKNSKKRFSNSVFSLAEE